MSEALGIKALGALVEVRDGAPFLLEPVIPRLRAIYEKESAPGGIPTMTS